MLLARQLRPFLATTALTDFWDTHAEKILFLGRWCMRYDKQQDWKHLNYEVLPHPWDDREAMHRAAEYEEQVCESLLEALTDFLNEAHGERHSKEYWRIILVPWFLHYIQALHERYLCLRQAFDLYPGCYTIGLHPESYNAPRFFWDHLRGCMDDPYNLQLYASLMLAMGYGADFRRFLWDWSEGQTPSRRSRARWAYRVKSVLRTLMTRLAIHGRVLMVDMYVSRKHVFRLMWKTKFKARLAELPRDDEWDGAFKGMRHPLRNELANLLVRPRDEFVRNLIRTLPHNFPLLYLEGYPAIHGWAQGLLRSSRVRVLITANAIEGNEPFKIICAQIKEKGGKLIGVQHGGSYGSARYNPLERLERRTSDEYWSWGWEENGHSVKCMPNPNLSEFKARRQQHRTPGECPRILFVGNIVPRYHYRTWSCPTANQVAGYLEWQILFVRALKDEIRASLLFRPYPKDWGWGLRQRLLDACPDLRLTDPKEDYYGGLLRADLVVCDMNQTTLLETLAANIPTMAFFDPNLWELRPEAERDFDILRQAGILSSRPEHAAKALNGLWPNVMEWWERKEVQAVRRSFAAKYALNSHEWVKIWSRYLLKYPETLESGDLNQCRSSQE